MRTRLPVRGCRDARGYTLRWPGLHRLSRLQHLMLARIAVALVLAGTASGQAAPLEVRVAPVAPVDCGRGSLAATAEGAEPVEREWSGSTVIPLDRTRLWRIEARSERCWAAPAVVEPGSPAVSIALWPKRMLGGRATLPRGASMPAVVKARIASPPRTAPTAVPQTVVQCPVANGRFTCEVPATTLDVRIAAEGFAPHYFWDVAADNLGELRLSRGAVVTGRAAVSSGESPEGITVELRPASLAWSAEDHALGAAQARAVKTNARGFFLFGNVAAGEYVASATKAGWSRAEYRVHVAPTTTEAPVGRDLVVPPLSRIEVFITPPVDAGQRPWKVHLGRNISLGSMPLAEGTATLTGHWSYDGLDTGPYIIHVKDANGANMAIETAIVSGGTVHVPVRIDQVPVRGTLTVRGEPAQARLAFNDGYGKVVHLGSDAEGRFSGVLPKEGAWDIEVRRRGRRLRVALDDVDVRRSDATGYAELDLELPDGRVHGMITTEDGQPVEGAVVIRRGKKRIGGEITGADGSFDLDGLPTGDAIIGARSKGRESELVPYRITSEKGEPLRLVVRERREARVRLLSPDGRPVSGAEVNRFSTFSRGWMEAITGPRGEVTLSGSPNDPQIPLVVLAIGFPLKLTAVPAGGSETIELPFAPVAGILFVASNGPHLPSIGVGTLPTFGIASLTGGPVPPEGLPARRVPGGVELLLEPGQYTVCNHTKSRCQTRYVAAGARETIDTTKWED